MAKLIIAVVLTALLLLGVMAAGCQSGTRDKVEEIDEILREGTSQLAEVTGFIGTLKEFDFENANFLQNALGSIGTSRAKLRVLKASTDRLDELTYDGELEPLGQYIRLYIDATREGIAQLDEVYNGLEEILKAIEPILREEAVITQLEQPQDDAELLVRLRRLEAATVPAISNLQGVEVPALLADYKTLFLEVFTTLLNLTRNLIVVASGGSTTIDLETNPDFDSMNLLIAGYGTVVEELYVNLKVSKIDAVLEQVELEINRLYVSRS
ncbi:MAG: hypothetical protein A2W01_00420 [Candidatus Solincola sediminis]|uniref:Uncharacterized protein n=1 Tax=Candidatus Solincola sediminis TaxID=1797199 RepID=A0A1F2WHT0_9ACTN|nr:MAG: hypothetical protein A2Y75_04075 [Candidatus Solincola sediminis]OFW61730.1 MAG: hypothetical protein A2W01_00420 [Candidatus Solincola sediminis]